MDTTSCPLRLTAPLLQKLILFFSSFDHFHLGASQNCNHCPDPLGPSQTLSEPSGEARWASSPPAPAQLLKRARVDEKANAAALSFMAHKLSFRASALSYWSEKDKHTPLSRARLHSLPSITCPFTGVLKIPSVIPLVTCTFLMNFQLQYIHTQCFFSQCWSHEFDSQETENRMSTLDKGIFQMHEVSRINAYTTYLTFEKIRKQKYHEIFILN